MRNICRKIQIHPFFYLVSFIAFFTGNFKSFCLFTSILVVHECGHIFAAFHFKWNIEMVTLFPFGALTMFKEQINKPMREELFIVLMGPIFQCLYYYFLSFYSFPYLESFHYGLLIFNLLPITSLDGSKIVLLCYQRFFSYWSSQYVLFITSIISFGLILFYSDKSLVLFLVFIILIYKVILEFLRRKNLFSKFLLERILYSFSFPRRMIIYGKNVKKMKRDTKHIFFTDGIYETERVYLRKRFDFKGKA